MRVAGWYTDPFDSGQQRYWNSTSWTSKVRPQPSRLNRFAGRAKKTAVETGKKVSEAARDARVEKVIVVTCGACQTVQDVVIGGGAEGILRSAGVVGGALVLGTAGAVVGGGIGIASHGTAIAGTLPLAAAGAVGGALVGDRLGDTVASIIRSHACSNCDEPLITRKSGRD